MKEKERADIAEKNVRAVEERLLDTMQRVTNNRNPNPNPNQRLLEAVQGMTSCKAGVKALSEEHRKKMELWWVLYITYTHDRA